MKWLTTVVPPTRVRPMVKMTAPDDDLGRRGSLGESNMDIDQKKPGLTDICRCVKPVKGTKALTKPNI
jgi:hypothetical protein